MKSFEKIAGNQELRTSLAVISKTIKDESIKRYNDVDLVMIYNDALLSLLLPCFS